MPMNVVAHLAGVGADSIAGDESGFRPVAPRSDESGFRPVAPRK
jgi:hypothetical protein